MDVALASLGAQSETVNGIIGYVALASLGYDSHGTRFRSVKDVALASLGDEARARPVGTPQKALG